MARDHEAPERQAKKPRLHLKAAATALNVTAQEGQREAAQLNNGERVQDEGEAEGQLGGRVQHLSVLRGALWRWCEEGKLRALTTFLAGVTAASRLSSPPGAQLRQPTCRQGGPPTPAPVPVTPLGHALALFQTRGGRAQPQRRCGKCPASLAPGTMAQTQPAPHSGRLPWKALPRAVPTRTFQLVSFLNLLGSRNPQSTCSSDEPPFSTPHSPLLCAPNTAPHCAPLCVALAQQPTRHCVAPRALRGAAAVSPPWSPTSKG